MAAPAGKRARAFLRRYLVDDIAVFPLFLRWLRDRKRR
jgi:hypothetical protein